MLAQAQPTPIASWSFDKQEKNTYVGVGKGTFTYAGAVVEAGVVSGRVVTVANGKKGGAASFTEQPPGFIRVPIDLSLIAAKGFSVSFWLRPVGLTSLYGTCVDFGSSKGFVIRLNSTNRLTLSLGGKWNVITTTERLVDPVWTHIALTFDGTLTRFYVGGFEVGNDPDMDITRLGSDLFLGAVEENVKSPDGSSVITTVKPLFGDLDELQIYAQALTPAEIAKAAGVKPAR
ncbi:MAG: LamG domain-containing protein [Opitutaceae bacterium]|nr:LamG domain-containing protein [Opitutaceae bacterium]